MKLKFWITRGLVILMSFTLLTSCGGDDNSSPEKNENVGTAVDLGLSVKWADRNVDAASPEKVGNYFAWGELNTKNVYSEATYKYFNTDSNGYVGIGSNICGTKYDVAHIKWGASWRMPTFDEEQELIANCNCEVATLNGSSVLKFTSKKNGNSIFIPFSGEHYNKALNDFGSEGFCWSGTLKEPGTNVAYALYVSDIVSTNCYFYSRYVGLPIRPVMP